MKKIISIAAAAALVIALLIGLSVVISNSADNIDETVENDSLYVFKPNTDLPDGLQVFSTDDTAASAPALWRVTSSDGGVMYLLGSVHALSADYYPLSAVFGAAFDECSAVAVEIKNVDLFDTMQTPNVQFSEKLDKGDSLKNHLTDEVYSTLSDRLSANGSDIAEYDGYAPWYVYNNAEISKGDSKLSKEYGIDRIIQIMANIEGKEIYSVETLDAKTAYYPEMDEKVMGMLIRLACVEDPNDFEQMAAFWSEGNFEAATDIAMSGKDTLPEEKELWQQYLKYSLDDRNVIMAAKAEEYISSGEKVFMTVGENHLAGDKGLIALLKSKGYTVERIE